MSNLKTCLLGSVVAAFVLSSTTAFAARVLYGAFEGPIVGYTFNFAEDLLGTDKSLFRVQDTDSKNSDNVDLFWPDLDHTSFSNLQFSFGVAEDETTDGDEDIAFDNLLLLGDVTLPLVQLPTGLLLLGTGLAGAGMSKRWTHKS